MRTGEHLRRDVHANHCAPELRKRRGDDAGTNADFEHAPRPPEIGLDLGSDQLPSPLAAAGLVVAIGDAIERDAAPRHARIWMRNTGWSGAMRRRSSSGDFALTPPKKTPTSAFQRLT